jgi:hypothetical protein
MNRLATLARNQPLSVLVLGATLTAVIIVGLALAAAIAAITIQQKQLYSNPLCLTSECVKRFTETIEPALAVAKGTIDLGVAIATIGGIFVALLSYLSSANNAALTNHIEHLKVFTEYIDSEIEKRDRLSRALFDTLFLYGKIFSQSRSGRTTVSEDYRVFLVELKRIIEESNERCVVGTPGGFSYNEHQRRVRDHMAKIGITVFSAPRNDYFEMESQLLSLLHRLSQSFCPPGTLPELPARKYY